MLNLDKFYDGKKLWSEACWDTCGGSHCCTLKKFATNLKFTPKDAQILHLYEFEVDWLIANKQLDLDFERTLKKESFQFNGHELSFYSVQCGYNGLCPNHKFRPLSCFFYPYLPYFDKEGKITGLANLSIYDDLYDCIEKDKPCTLYSKFNTGMYQELVDNYLNDPRFYFYTNLYIRLKQKMVENFKKINNKNNFEETLAGFEMMFALKRLVTAEEAIDITKEENENFGVFK